MILPLSSPIITLVATLFESLIIIDYEPDHYIFASYGPGICRTCMVTHDEYKCLSIIMHIPPRSISLHEQRCKLFSNPLGDHYSETYGIKRWSALLDIPHFSIFDGGLPHDVMHDVLEGVVVRKYHYFLNAVYQISHT